MRSQAGPPPDSSLESPPESQRTAAFLASVEHLTGSSCRQCERTLCGHEAVVSVILGFKDSARCSRCVADAMQEEGEALHHRVWQYVRRHECYMQGWHWADRHEGLPPSDPHDSENHRQPPFCASRSTEDPSPGSSRIDVAAGVVAPPGASPSPDGPSPEPATVVPDAQSRWDAGDMACGDLVLELRRRIAVLQPGDRFYLIATDPAAPEDIPAWCGLTRNVLVEAHHPNYIIQRKET